jgi:prefoldin subunit 5
LRGELTSAGEATQQIRIEREAEARAHAGTAARLQELQAQLEQARAQQQRMQEGFSSDLAKAREAVDAADRRAAATEKRALLEIEQERQARAKAEKQVDALRAQVSQGDARERQATLEHAESIARLQSKCDTVSAAHRALQQANQALEQELRGTREQLQASQHEATHYRTEAQTVQAVLERLTTPAPPASSRPAKKKAST